MAENTVCALVDGRMQQAGLRQQTFAYLSRRDKNDSFSNLVESDEEAWDFDDYAALFARKHQLQTKSSGKTRTLSSVDAVKTVPIRDRIILIEFKYDCVGEVKARQGGSGHFVFLKPNPESNKKRERERKDYEINIYRKLLESVLMLIADDMIPFDSCKDKISALLVVKAEKNQLARFSDLVKGDAMNIFPPLCGALFEKIQVVNEKVFDATFGNSLRS